VEQAGGVDKIAEIQTHNDLRVAAHVARFLLLHFRARLDEERLHSLYQQSLLHAAEVETNVGADDDTDSDSDGECDGEADGHLQGESGEERSSAET